MSNRRVGTVVVAMATSFVSLPSEARFLQVDPVGYKDQANLYTYVNNDPMNRSDPTGTYQRGDGFKNDREWAKFDRRQQQVANDMTKAAGKLDTKAAKRDADGKSGGDLLRQEANELRTGAAALRDTSTTAAYADVVPAAQYDRLGRQAESQAFTRIGSNRTTFRGGATGALGSNLSNAYNIIGHDVFHTGPGGGLSDVKIGGIFAYRGAGADSLQVFNSIAGTSLEPQNPDSLMARVYP